jgi:hypothetical protein
MILRLYLIEEFERVLLENKECQSRVQDFEERTQAFERVKNFNLEKISIQERLLNDQSIKLIKRKNKILKLREKSTRFEENASELKENLSKMKGLYKSVSEKVR